MDVAGDLLVYCTHRERDWMETTLTLLDVSSVLFVIFLLPVFLLLATSLSFSLLSLI